MFADDAPINILEARDRFVIKYSIPVMLGLLGIFAYKVFSNKCPNVPPLLSYSHSGAMNDALYFAFTAASVFLTVYSAILLCVKGVSRDGYVNRKHACLAILGFSGSAVSLSHFDNSIPCYHTTAI